RAQLRHVGEPAGLHYRRPGVRPRRVVVLVDVSGSMRPYADSLLRLAHTMVRQSPRTVEVFTIGTRLTRVTPALRHRDAEFALRSAGDVVPDWSGGTRLGEVMKVFLDRWGQRGTARRAVVVVCSDGWERGDAALLGAQLQRLAGLAHRVVWLNPHRGKRGYEPVQSGIVAVLPHLDDLVAGHSLAAFAELLEVVADA
ncbi:MAG: VWA domain-containing protein, partial [Kribbellaceae bacterium]|nr:VWA domain-containing protein [Kribbellaceae bacterium]